MAKNIKIEVTRKGYFAMWEQGGGYTNTGFATVICGPNGEKLRPFYIRRKGELANREHALLPIRPGYHIIRASHHRGDFEIEVMRVLEVKNPRDEHAYVIAETVYSFRNNEWVPDLPKELEPAVLAAMDKAECYHCRNPHYIITEK